MNIQHFFDPRTWTLTYVVWDAASRDAVVIDPVLDFDPASGKIWTESLDALEAFLGREALTLRMILETHAHADHLSGAHELKRRTGAPVAIGAQITDVQRTFAPFFGLGPEVAQDGSQFEHLLSDGEQLTFGGLSLTALHTPGHTPACMSFKVGDAVFTGDALFVPDTGVGRCDFPGGSADSLYQSVHERLYALPDQTRVFVGHDYQNEGRALQFETTIGESKARNQHLAQATSREAFVTFRTGRDAGLAAPRLLLPSIQVNVDAGRLPPPDAHGVRALRVPLRIPANL